MSGYFRSRYGHPRTSRRLAAIRAATVLLSLSAASCTDLLLSPYRDDKLLQEHHYVLGEQYIDVGPIKLCYQEQGRGEDVLILPGLCTDIDFWQLTIPVLAEQYHVVAVDPPGYGKSDKPDVPYDLPWLAEQIVRFMDAKQMQQATIIGGSMGGHLALLVALNHPDRVTKLVLMGSSGAWPKPGILLVAGIEAFWGDAVATDHLRRNWPDIFSRLFKHKNAMTQRLFRYQMALRADPAKYAAEGTASSRSLRSIFFNSCRDRLSQVVQPTLLIWGESDCFHLQNEARCFREHLPDAVQVIVPDAAHEVIVDQPETFNRLVLTFLKEGTRGVRDVAVRP